MSENISLGRIASTKPHLLADTIEVAIAYAGYDQFSITDTVTLINTSPKDAKELLPLDTPDIDDNENSDEVGEIVVNEKNQLKAEDAFKQLEYRALILGECYPFVIEKETLLLKPSLTEIQKLYLLLLACSRTRTFKSKGLTQKLADAFEELCALSLKTMISPHGNVYLFGPNSEHRKSIFGTDLTDAVKVLSKKLGMNLSPGWERNVGSSGDGKIDLVGVFDFEDSASGYQVIIGQCASMEDETNWEKKRQEAEFSKKRGVFHYLVEPAAALFFPGFFRSSDGEWIDTNKVSGVIAVDRLRLINTIIKSDKIAFPFDDFFSEHKLLA